MGVLAMAWEVKMVQSKLEFKCFKEKASKCLLQGLPVLTSEWYCTWTQVVRFFRHPKHFDVGRLNHHPSVGEYGLSSESVGRQSLWPRWTSSSVLSSSMTASSTRSAGAWAQRTAQPRLRWTTCGSAGRVHEVLKRVSGFGLSLTVG